MDAEAHLAKSRLWNLSSVSSTSFPRAIGRSSGPSSSHRQVQPESYAEMMRLLTEEKDAIKVFVNVAME